MIVGDEEIVVGIVVGITGGLIVGNYKIIVGDYRKVDCGDCCRGLPEGGLVIRA